MQWSCRGAVNVKGSESAGLRARRRGRARSSGGRLSDLRQGPRDQSGLQDKPPPGAQEPLPHYRKQGLRQTGTKTLRPMVWAQPGGGEASSTHGLPDRDASCLRLQDTAQDGRLGLMKTAESWGGGAPGSQRGGEGGRVQRGTGLCVAPARTVAASSVTVSGVRLALCLGRRTCVFLGK